MKKKWANRIVLVAVAGSALLAASSGLNQPQALASAGDNTHNGITLPPVNDIVWTQPNASGHTISLSKPDPSQTIVHGVTPQGSDLAIGLYTSSSTNLPSSQYHHLLYRLRIAAGPQPSCATNGRILYTTQWPNWLGHQKFTRAISPEDEPMYCAYGDYCIYYLDLSRNDNDGRAPYEGTWSGYSLTDPSPWPTAGVKGFGMWPHEVWYDCSGQAGPAYFDIDYVYLTGDIVARARDGYTYTVKYNVSDPDGGSVVSTIRYQEVDELRLPSNSPACDGSNFNSAWHDFSPAAQKTTNLSPSASYSNKVYLPIVISAGGGGGETGLFNETYTLNFSDNAKFTDGKSYYLCIRVSDGVSQRYGVSTAPVLRAPRSPNNGGT
jgi:hypothetical protein